MLQQLTKSKDSLKKPLFVADTRWLNGFGTGTGCRVGAVMAGVLPPVKAQVSLLMH
jgi:hypothetical protein